MKSGGTDELQLERQPGFLTRTFDASSMPKASPSLARRIMDAKSGIAMMQSSLFAARGKEMSRPVAAVIAGLLVLSACATPDKGVPVNGAELKQLLPGAQVESTGWDDSHVVAHYAANGRVSEFWGGHLNATGTWRIDGDAVCLTWDPQFKPTWQDGCWSAQKIPGGTLQFIETQGPAPGQVTARDAMIRRE
jgi:hypothetical protein